jgi:putative ABC transport system ATP-binding protein
VTSDDHAESAFDERRKDPTMTEATPTDATAAAATTATALAPLYELRGVERSFTKGGVTVRALRGVDLDIGTGEMLTLEGPSGSGKSTLLQLLGALDTPTAGIIRFAGRELENEPDRVLTEIRSAQIGFVFQQFNLIPTLTAEENVAIAMVPREHSRAARLTRARELLGQVGLEHRLGHLPTRLSGGEQQRVAIARSLANSPRVLIADEPTGNLDTANAAEVIALLNQLHGSSGVTVVVATHDEEIAASSPRRVRMRDGAIISDSLA